MLKKVKDERSLVRDSNNRAILNTDTKAYEEYVAKRSQAQRTEDRIENLESDINNIKDTLNTILQLLSKG